MDDQLQQLEDRVGRWLDALGLDLDYRVTRTDEGHLVELKGPDEKLFTQDDGKLLLAFQYLINRVEEKHEGPRVVLEVGDFRERKRKMLASLARETAERVVKAGRKESLGWFNPYERRLIHLSINDFPELASYSLGRDYEKEVFIDLRDQIPADILAETDRKKDRR